MFDANAIPLQRVATADGEMAYRAVGCGDPLLCIHGWGGSSVYWQLVMPLLAEGRRVIVPDFPGFGATPPLPAGQSARYSHGGFADIAGRFLDALGVGRCDVIAHSFGGGVGIVFAATQPDRVRTLVLSNFSTFRHEIERRQIILVHRMSALMVKARRLSFMRTDKMAVQMAKRYFHVVPEDFSLLRSGLDDFLAMDSVAGEQTMLMGLGWDTWHRMAEIQAPTLLIHSHQDEIMPPRNAEFTISRVPGGTMRWLDGTGHLPMVEQPRAFADVARWFLR